MGVRAGCRPGPEELPAARTPLLVTAIAAPLGKQATLGLSITLAQTSLIWGL